MREEDIDLALSKLERLGHDPSGWDTLYRDPATGTLWEVIYPQSYMHGGGPRQLSEIAPSVASIRYSAVFQTRPLPNSD